MNRRQAVEGSGDAPTKKQQEVLEVATEYFLRDGYQGTSINAMARESGISKESIYRYFSSKKELFEAVVDKELEAYRNRFNFVDLEHESLSLTELLARAGESILQAISNDRVLSLRRLVFQEATQSPEIGQHYFEIGPQAAYAWLEKLFAVHLARVGSDADPKALASHFPAMLLHRLMLERECRVIDAPTPEEITRHAKGIAEEFHRLYFAPEEIKPS